MHTTAASLARPRARVSGLRGLAPWIAIALAASAVAAGSASEPPWSWFALAALAATVVGALLWSAPELLAGMLPVLMLPPQFAKVFAHELGLVIVAVALVVHGWRTRAPWLTRLDRIELAFLALFLWGVVTGFWSESTWWWAFGVRKTGIGLLALWTGWRLARFVSWETMRVGLTATVWGLSAYTMLKAIQSGALNTAGWVDRKLSTDVGWGTSNYIAAILVVMLPSAMEVALRNPSRLLRVLAWLALPLAALVMMVSASRGGVLFVLLIVLLSVFRQRAARSVLAVSGSVGVVALATALSPAGARFLARFTDAQELGSIVVRFLYYREGWRRLVHAWPGGMGLGQGIATIDRLGTEDPHNYWLVIGGELGLVGLVLWVFAIVLVWRRIRALVRDPSTTAIGYVLQLTFAIAMLNCLFEPTFQGLHYHFLIYWLLGSSFGAADSARRAARCTSERTSASGRNPVST